MPTLTATKKIFSLRNRSDFEQKMHFFQASLTLPPNAQKCQKQDLPLTMKTFFLEKST